VIWREGRPELALGITALGPLDTARAAAASARMAEDVGFDYVMVGDNLTIFRDPYAVMAAIALATERIMMGPQVTNPVTRHPVATANAIATIHEMSGGRAYLGIGTGWSAVHNAGLKPLSTEELGAALREMDAVFPNDAPRASGAAEPDPAIAQLAWPARRPPVLVAAGKWSAMQLAAHAADGVILRYGDVAIEDLGDLVARIRDARDAGPRAGAPFTVSMYTPCCLTDSLDDAHAALSGNVSARARTLRPEDAPEEMADAVREYRGRYSFAHHALNDPPVNMDLLRELGLADYMLGRYAIAGPVSAVTGALSQLVAAGVDAVTVASLMDREAQLERWAEVLPTFPRTLAGSG
jgi:5,10-methylenetetrahydromethanopterin reductase